MQSGCRQRTSAGTAARSRLNGALPVALPHAFAARHPGSSPLAADDLAAACSRWTAGVSHLGTSHCARRAQGCRLLLVPASTDASSARPLTATAAADAEAPAAGGDGQMEQEWEQEIDELMKLVQLLPASVRAALEDHPQMLELLEVVMDLGRPPLARFPGGDVKLSTAAITAEDLEFAVRQVGEFGGDNRAGIDRTLHRISCMRNRTGRIIGLTCRVGRAIKGSAQMVRDLVLSGASILLLGRPGVGKTTAIREVSRMLADECTKRVVIVDTSNEIGGDGDIPHSGIGRARRMQVAHPEAQHRVMIEAVENHMPQVIVIDEIGTSEECGAARTIAQRGVQLVATAHGNELENVIKNPQLADLVGGIQSVTLGDEEAKRRGVQKSILERAAPPTFDVCIEMLERTKWRAHLDVGQAVDMVLAGGESGGQVREKAADGTILKYNYNPAISGVIRTSSGPAMAGPRGGGGGGGAGAGAGTAGAAGAAAAGSYRESAAAADAPPLRAPGNSFVRSPVATTASLDGDDDGAAGDGDFGAGKRLRRITSRQAVAGVTADSASLRLYPYELDEDVLWEVLTDMRLTGKIFITSSLANADAVLALRAKVKHNAELRAMARESSVPIYAVKTSGSANLVKAFRTLLGIDPSAGGAFGPGSDSEEGPVPPAVSGTTGSILGSVDEADAAPGGSSSSSGFGGFGGGGSSAAAAKGYSYKAWAEDEALEEAQVAVTEIVIPLHQPVELMPRARSVLEAQIKLLERYKLSHEIVGAGAEARIRILPAVSAPAATGGRE
ncbi:hypothetical protein CHLRE_16g676850v5 [Chlamydomonas reinhardtii]|uniref:AAA+ ATPase domain-containing protein n=1 Tax=Chlamydomonas reinhardtii TaxID=3055 RepID=A0A2K3CVB9_CHLRE|nr:uncharacterized protein CHLRE_16g676850v5 [Chlamydomonas reinhardtii]PNW72226.1 hypothetical protein CHLRE_16g676850v5 [Chlamydomonas reinhardtii]